MQTPIDTIQFKDLYLTNPVRPTPILNHISGTIPGGQITAIYGPSGSGKTTLLNTLAFRMPYLEKVEFTGQMAINGKPVQKLVDSAYVQ